MDRWLSEPSARLRGYRDDFFLKLMAAVQAGDPKTLDGVLRRQPAPGLRRVKVSLHVAQVLPKSCMRLAELTTPCHRAAGVLNGHRTAVPSGRVPLCLALSATSPQ